MDRNRIEIPYDSEAEHALARVALLRAGVPKRVLDVHMPGTRPTDPSKRDVPPMPSPFRVEPSEADV